jgi:hypothetical protein
MNLAGCFRRKERVAGRRIAGESFLVPICGSPADMENIFVLNPLADFIWQRLDGKHSLEAIVGEMIDEFEVSRERAAGDALEFVERLLQNDLVEELA